jgi:hypothetical protein
MTQILLWTCPGNKVGCTDCGNAEVVRALRIVGYVHTLTERAP